MFDVLNTVKSYKIKDNITGFDVEIATFNANLIKDSNINVYMVINYPELYNTYKEDILSQYREFNAEVTNMAIQMGLASVDDGIQTLSRTNDNFNEEVKNIVLDKLTQVIESLGDIRVNPVPTLDIGSRFGR